MESLKLHNDIQEVGLLGEWVESLGDSLMLPMPAIFQLNLALEEAVVNVMNYAYPGETGKPIFITAEKNEENSFVFQLIDEGIAFDPTQHNDPDTSLPAEDREIGGLGIFLVKQIMKKVEYQRQDNKNVLTMYYEQTEGTETMLSLLDD